MTKRIDLPSEIQTIFKNRSSITWKEVIEGEHAHLFQKEVQKGHLELVYNVKNKLNKKTVRMIRPLLLTRTASRHHSYVQGKHEKTA